MPKYERKKKYPVGVTDCDENLEQDAERGIGTAGVAVLFGS